MRLSVQCPSCTSVAQTPKLKPQAPTSTKVKEFLLHHRGSTRRRQLQTLLHKLPLTKTSSDDLLLRYRRVQQGSCTKPARPMAKLCCCFCKQWCGTKSATVWSLLSEAPPERAVHPAPVAGSLEPAPVAWGCDFPLGLLSIQERPMNL